MLLSKKLEALEQAANQPHRDRRHSTPKAEVFVPRTAAQQFSATTTSMDAAPRRVRSSKRRSHVPIEQEQQWTADGKPVVNTKTMMAALNIGMSENEAGAAEGPECTSFGAGDRGKNEAGTAAAPKRTSSGSRAKRSSQDRRGSLPDSGVQRSASRGYRPGDAAKRNAAKRASIAGTGDVKLVAIKHGSQTVYEWIENPHTHNRPAPASDPFGGDLEIVPEYRAARDREVQMPYDLPNPDDDEEQPLGTQRPRFLAHDRPHWAQQSQCGDDMRSNFLHIPLHRPRDKESNAASQSTAVAAPQRQSPPKRPDALRRHSSAPHQQQEGTLISDAVKTIKKEERKNRRQSVMGFFKKL